MTLTHSLRIALLSLTLGAASLFAQAKYDEAPRPLRNPAPEYPAELKSEGVKAKVILAVFIDENGDISEVKVIRSNDDRFSEVAANSVRNNWKFSPATLAGKPVACKLNIPVRFEPDGA